VPVAIALAGARDACGAAPQYTMEDIAIIRFQPDPDAQGHFGINNKGEIAFTRKLATGEYRATIYLPQAAYGLIAGVHDLATVITGPSQEPILTGDSYARDIGDEGFVVGQFEGTQVAEGQAFIADLANHLSLPNRVFVYEGLSGTECTVAWARAMAVSNDLDPFVVIETGREARCVLSGCQLGVPIECHVSGATLSSIGSSPVLDPFEVDSCRTGTRAFDIERDSSLSSSPPFLAAAADIAPRTPPVCTVQGLPCDDPGIAYRGDPEVAPELGDLGITEDRPAAARGVNFVGYSCGSVRPPGRRGQRRRGGLPGHGVGARRLWPLHVPLVPGGHRRRRHRRVPRLACRAEQLGSVRRSAAGTAAIGAGLHPARGLGSRCAGGMH
jgi:hypothetical protein